jgi:hypothetical protein
MLTKAALERLSEMRLNEAVALLEARLYPGAYYLGGYSAELALKACIARAFQPDTTPDRRFVEKIYTHDLRKLVELAGLEANRRARVAVDAVFAENWEYVEAWSENARYTETDEESARLLVEGLRDPNHRVFEWIRLHW